MQNPARRGHGDRERGPTVDGVEPGDHMRTTLPKFRPT
jgi:hypothetical protein